MPSSAGTPITTTTNTNTTMDTPTSPTAAEFAIPGDLRDQAEGLDNTIARAQSTIDTLTRGGEAETAASISSMVDALVDAQLVLRIAAARLDA